MKMLLTQIHSLQQASVVASDEMAGWQQVTCTGLNFTKVTDREVIDVAEHLNKSRTSREVAEREFIEHRHEIVKVPKGGHTVQTHTQNRPWLQGMLLMRRNVHTINTRTISGQSDGAGLRDALIQKWS